MGVNRFILFILLLLHFLVTSSKCFSIFRRTKREGVKIGDLPRIIPPVSLKNGEQKYPTPGWTHCIKYLKADVRWRSIRHVNLHTLQATQFQCSWFITSEKPDSQVRLSFEKLDFGEQVGNTCTQQFLELIDIKAGKSQGRLCGNKRHGDYVSAGQRIRIDIQGSEPLVAKLRSNDEPFIISYKAVKEPAGFRKESVKNTELVNKVKNTVGSTVDRTSDRSKNIFGTSNQPGSKDRIGNNGDESENRSSLTVWQVVIIIFVALSIVACIVGVIIKKFVVDNKKEKEYLEELSVENGSNDKNSLQLPGLPIEKPLYKKNNSDGNTQSKRPSYKTFYENVIPRSNSKPERSDKTNHEMKRRNSLGNAQSNFQSDHRNLRHASNDDRRTNTLQQNRKTSYGDSKFIRDSNQTKAFNEQLLDDTPLSRAPRAKAKTDHKSTKGDGQKSRRDIDAHKNAVKHTSSRKIRKAEATSTEHRLNARESRKKNKESIGNKKDATVKLNGNSKEIAEVATPSSRAVKTTKKHHSKPRDAKSSRKKNSANPEGHEKQEEKIRKQRERSKRENRVTGSKKLKSTGHNHKKSKAETERKSKSNQNRDGEKSKTKHKNGNRTKQSDERRQERKHKSKTRTKTSATKAA